MTKHPDSIEQINAVVDFILDPCDAPLEAYARTLWPALLTMLFEYYMIDLVQIFTSYVKPNRALGRVRSGGHGRTRAPRGKPRTWSQRWGRWLTFDPWDEFGKRLPGSEDFRSRNVTPGVHTLWEVYGHAQRILYWVFIFDLVTDFFYNWMQGLYKTEFCQQLNRAWISARGGPKTGSALVGWNAIGMADVVKIRGIASWNGFGGAMACNSCSVSVSVDWRPISTNQPASYVRVRVRGPNGTAEGDPSTAEQGQANVTGSFSGPNAAFVCEWISDGNFESSNQMCIAIGNVGSGDLPAGP